MSGGTFEYRQYWIQNIVDEIKQYIRKNGKKKTSEELKEESWRDSDWYKRYPEDLNHYKYPDEVIEKFKKGIYYLKRAQIYVQRIDYLLAGDDGEDSFMKRLDEELKELDGKE